jgi:hypothetical protein
MAASTMNVTRDQVIARFDEGTWLKASPQTGDTANGAVLLASDLASKMHGTVHNATAGVCTD